MASVGSSRGYSFLYWLVAGLPVLLCLLLIGVPVRAADEPSFPLPPRVPSNPLPPQAIGKGVFLIASPGLMDPNFHQTVVLICEYGEEGTLGLVINRPTDVLLSEALPGISVLKGTSYVLFVGGPVQPNGILMLYRVGQEPANTRKVMERVYLGLDLDTVNRVITKPQPTETFRAYAGYAGWAPGQLEFEMSLGSWAVVPADLAAIFDKDPSTLWSEMIEALQAPRVIRN